MKNTKEFMESVGFTLEKSIGGSMRYYYHGTQFSSNFYFPNISTGTLSYSEKELPTMEEVVKTLVKSHHEHGMLLGRNSVTSELRSILEIE